MLILIAAAGPAAADILPLPKPEICKSEKETTYLASMRAQHRRQEGELIVVKGDALPALLKALQAKSRASRAYVFIKPVPKMMKLHKLTTHVAFISLFSDECLQWQRPYPIKRWKALSLWLTGI